MIILLTGNDAYTLAKKLKELRAKFTREVDQSKLNSSELRAESIELGILRREINASPFLARRRMLILNNCLSAIAGNPEVAAEWNDIQPSVANTDNHSPIVIVLEIQTFDEPKRSKKPSSARLGRASEGKPKRKSSTVSRQTLLDNLPLSITRIECWIRTGADIVALAQRIAGERKLTFDRSALEHIAGLLLDAWAAASLVEMVTSFHGTNPDPITAREVDQFTITSIDDVLFTLQDALGTRNKKLLLKECAQKLYAGVHPLVILATIHRTLLLLRQAKGGELPSGVHPFVARKITDQSRGWDATKLKTIAGKAMVGDALMKSSSGLSAETILMRLALSL